MGWLLNLKGKKFGRLTVIQRVKNNGENVMWRCLCQCGTHVSIRSASLVHNRTNSCGCLHRDMVRKKPYFHIFTLLKRRVKYAKFNPTKKRCHLTFSQFLNFTAVKNCHYCSSQIQWEIYSGRDGNRHKSNLDRKDNHKGYSEENCVVCCSRCNKMKGTLNYKEFFDFTAPIRNYENHFKRKQTKSV